VVGNAVAATVVARWEGSLDPEASPEIDPKPTPAHLPQPAAGAEHF
jgi:hypothetical protein